MRYFLLCLILFAQNSTVFSQTKTDEMFSGAEQRLLFNEGVRLWEKRDDKVSLEEALSKFELVHASYPDNLQVLTYLSRGHFLLAEFLTSDEGVKKNGFSKGREYGEKGLRTNNDFDKFADKDIKKAVSYLTTKEIDLLFWAAANLGKYAKANGIFSSLKYKDQILEMIKKVESLNPNYFHGSVPRYWGSYYALAPSIAGGDMKKSKDNFRKAIDMAPEYLGTKVLFAELYWVKMEDQKEFKNELNAVLAAPLGPVELHPENRLEKAKAQKLLKQVDKLF